MQNSSERDHTESTPSGQVAKLAYSIPEACSAAGVNKDSIYRAINNGELHSLKVGRRRLIRLKSLDDWLTRLELRMRDETAA